MPSNKPLTRFAIVSIVLVKDSDIKKETRAEDAVLTVGLETHIERFHTYLKKSNEGNLFGYFGIITTVLYNDVFYPYQNEFKFLQPK